MIRLKFTMQLHIKLTGFISKLVAGILYDAHNHSPTFMHPCRNGVSNKLFNKFHLFLFCISSEKWIRMTFNKDFAVGAKTNKNTKRKQLEGALYILRCEFPIPLNESRE